jgi:hypothetical protein
MVVDPEDARAKETVEGDRRAGGLGGMSAAVLISTLGLGLILVAAFFGVRYHNRTVADLAGQIENLTVQNKQMKREIDLAYAQIRRLADRTDSRSAADKLRAGEF